MAAVPMQEIPTITGTQAIEFILKAKSPVDMNITKQQMAIYTQLRNSSNKN